MSEIFDATFILVLIAVALAGAALVVSLVRKGVPRDQLAGQALIRAGDIADAGRDKVIAWLRAELEAQARKATLRSVYFDADDFLADLGRLPAGFEPSVYLDDGLKRSGTGSERVDYWTNKAGNVGREKPTS